MTKNTAFKLSHDAREEGFQVSVHHCCGDWLVNIDGVGSGYDARVLRHDMKRKIKATGSISKRIK